MKVYMLRDVNCIDGITNIELYKKYDSAVKALNEKVKYYISLPAFKDDIKTVKVSSNWVYGFDQYNEDGIFKLFIDEKEVK